MADRRRQSLPAGDALSLAEDLFRLLPVVRQRAPELAHCLGAAAAKLPGAAAEPVRYGLLLNECAVLLSIAVRLGAVSAEQVRPVERRLGVIPPAVREDGPRSPPRPADRLVVDGSNFLGRARGFRLGDTASRDRFVIRLQEHVHRHPSHRVDVFFDAGHTSRRTTGGVTEHTVSRGKPADEVIAAFVGRLPKSELPRTSVITDDAELRRRVTELGAVARDVSWLADLLEPPPSPSEERTAAAGSRDEWEEFFSRPPRRPGKAGPWLDE